MLESISIIMIASKDTKEDDQGRPKKMNIHESADSKRTQTTRCEGEGMEEIARY